MGGTGHRRVTRCVGWGLVVPEPGHRVSGGALMVCAGVRLPRAHMEEVSGPRAAVSHVALVQMREPHGWWALFRAWVRGAKR